MDSSTYPSLISEFIKMGLSEWLKPLSPSWLNRRAKDTHLDEIPTISFFAMFWNILFSDTGCLTSNHFGKYNFLK